MTGNWQIRLQGGPFDHDKAQINGELVPYIWVIACKNCGDTHWFSAPVQGAERYRKDEVDEDERSAVYVYEDKGLSPSNEMEEYAKRPTCIPDDNKVITPERETVTA